jgi:hypothetical protein
MHFLSKSERRKKEPKAHKRETRAEEIRLNEREREREGHSIAAMAGMSSSLIEIEAKKMALLASSHEMYGCTLREGGR